MNKIKLALAFFAGLLMFSCSDSDEALLYDNYDFINIKGDSVISRDGLQMVASVLDVTQDTFLKLTYSELNSQVTVGNNVFDLNLLILGANAGNYALSLAAGQPLDYVGYVDYRTMLADSTFKTDTYAITSYSLNWEDVDTKTVLLNVNCTGQKMVNDSTLTSRANIHIDGKIRAIKQ